VTCFSLGFLEQLLIWLVIVCAIVAIIRLVLPLALTPIPIVAQILNIVMWAVIAIAVIYIVFDLLSCLIGFPRLGLPR
jgi:nitric oxide reductase large subunit